MKKNKFITATLILMGSGLITKVLGMVIRILYTRCIGDEGVSLYSLVMPSYSLLITIAVMAMPFSISKLISEGSGKNRKIMSSASLIMLVVNVIVICLMIGFSKFIAINLLKDEKVYYLLIACSLTLPFISLSSILKGYFFGKQDMVPNAISNIIEQIVRIGIIVYILPLMMKKGVLEGVRFLIISNVFSEVVSILVFIAFLKKKEKIKIRGFKVDKEVSKSLLHISGLSVTGRLIGNVGYFLEPVILTNILMRVGMDRSVIVAEYGYYNAYSISLLLMPSFFISAISQSLLPEISHFKSERNNEMVKRRLKQGIIFSLLVGFVFSMGIYWFRDYLLNLMYKTNNGADYIKHLAPFFVLFYLEAPLSSVLVALGKVKEGTKISIYGVIIKLLVMSVLASRGMGIYALVYAEIINIIFIIGMDLVKIKKAL